MKTENDYTLMQKKYYEEETQTMAIVNHFNHNENPDYWNILLQPLMIGDWKEKTVLDFGCGCGRNVFNIITKFDVNSAHGCDISGNNIAYCKEWMPKVTNKSNYDFIEVDGQSLYPIESNKYDLIVSTIVLQHICVYTIRRKILEDMYRCLKSDGILSIQMGYGYGHPIAADYFENATHATQTNSGYDVRIIDPSQITNDLKEIGFKDITYILSHAWSDSHEKWIYVKGIK